MTKDIAWPHAAQTRRLTGLEGYPADVDYQAECRTCGIARGPLTKREAVAWVAGHNSAVKSMGRGAAS
jgi:hypothetical protein